MKSWPVQDARARFSERLEICIKEGPQFITRRHKQSAVLVSIAEWEQLVRTDKPTLKDLLLGDLGQADLPIPGRRNSRRRTTRVD